MVQDSGARLRRIRKQLSGMDLRTESVVNSGT
jgi:hypothetical protein